MGNVVIEQEGILIKCNEARLNETEGNVLLKDSVFIKDQNGELRADNALYYFDNKLGILSGNVLLSQKGQTISAESLDYDGIKRFVRMKKNVKIVNLSDNQYAYAEEGWYDLEKEEGSLEKNPHLELMREEKSPIMVWAKRFFLLNKLNKFFGYDSVVGLIDSITIFCDTIEYELNKDKGFLKNPVVREQNNQLSGSSGEFGLKDKEIEYFKVLNGNADYWTREGSRNIISGSTITILFNNSRAHRVIVEGEPRGLLYLKQRENAGD